MASPSDSSDVSSWASSDFSVAPRNTHVPNKLHTAPTVPPNPYSPENCVADSPLFKLPPELRNRIYLYVFGEADAISPDISSRNRAWWARRWGIHEYDDDDDLVPAPNPDIAVHTSILSVCQFVKAEAIEVLYDTRILRGYIIDLHRMLQSQDVYSRVRRIEFTGLETCISDDSSGALCKAQHTRHFRDVLVEVQRLPRLQSVLILSDHLTTNPHRSLDFWVHVLEFVREAGLGSATCVDVGRYQLHGKFKGIQIVDSKLIEMWPAVRDTPDDYNGFDDAMAMIDSLQSSVGVPNVAAWASHSSLRCWVDIQQQFVALNLSGEWDQLAQKLNTGGFDDDDGTEDEDKYNFFGQAARIAVRVLIDDFPLLRGGEHVLKRLQPNGDSNVLDEASTFLALNIVDYDHITTHPSMLPERRFRPIVWKRKKNDTDVTNLEYMAEQHSIALSDGASHEFVLDPALQYDVPACNLIERRLATKWLQDFRSRTWTSYHPHNANPTTLKQLTHLHLAIFQPILQSDSLDDIAYQHRRDQWAKGLLQRYILASEPDNPFAVERTSLG